MFFSRDKSKDHNPKFSWLAFMLMPIRMRDSYDYLYERLLSVEKERDELRRRAAAGGLEEVQGK